MHSILQYFRKNRVLALCEKAIHGNYSTLNLTRYEIEEVPEVVQQCNLMRLFLHNNLLKEIPTSIGNMENLQVLTLDHNNLDGFPVCICNLVNLKQLNVSNNDIRELPREIGNLTMLEEFWCNNTGLVWIPKEIGNCEQLITLGARCNNLTRLPKSALGRLTKLRWLTIEMNYVKFIPKTITGLKNLKHCNLSTNEIKRFPQQVRTMTELQFLFLNYNKLKNLPPEEVLEDCHFMKILNLSHNPFRNEADVVNKVQQHPYIVIDNVNEGGEIHDVDTDGDSSDWENSIVTSDINSTDESSSEHELEDISNLIPEISRFVTNFC